MSTHQDLIPKPHNAIAGHLREVKEGPSTERYIKDLSSFIQEPSHKDLYEIMKGHLEDFTWSFEDLLTRTCTRSC